MHNPLVSVIIPFYKGERYIQQAVQSILMQPYQNIEIILVNDGSPSGSDVCERISKANAKIKYYQKKNEGIGATRNNGIRQAAGEYIACLDQDDVWCNGFLDEKTVSAIETGKDVYVFSYYRANEDFTRGVKEQIEDITVRGGGKCYTI